MAWAKIDDQYFFHPKVIAAGRDARDLHLASIVYCSGQLTNGSVGVETLPLLGAMAGISDPVASAGRLVEVGLWDKVDGGGWALHDYLEYNPSREQVQELKRARAEAGRRGGLESARSKEQAKVPANAKANAAANTEPNEKQKSTPIPSPSPIPPPIPAEPAAAKRPRPSSGKNAVRKALEKYFIAKTKLPRPQMNTAKQKKAAGERWWQPLRRIAELADQDLVRATHLIDAALVRLEGLTVSAPQSILKTVESIFANEARGRAPPISVEDEWLADYGE